MFQASCFAIYAAVSDGCTIVLCSTVSPLYVESLEQRLQGNFGFLDIYWVLL